jgi:hypothetical protein
MPYTYKLLKKIFFNMYFCQLDYSIPLEKWYHIPMKPHRNKNAVKTIGISHL